MMPAFALKRLSRLVVVSTAIAVCLTGCRQDPVDQAIQRLKSNAPEERIGAAQVVVQSQTRAPKAEHALSAALQDSHPSVRRIAAEGLAKWGRTDLTTAAVETMARDLADENPNVQRGAVGALSSLDSPESTAALIGALESPAPAVREAAAKALVERKAAVTGEDQIRLSLIQGNVEQVAEQGRAAVPFLTALLTADPAMRASAATAIGLIGEPSSVRQAVAAMMEDAKSEETPVRMAAVNALGALNDAKGLPVLQNLARNDSELTVRSGATAASYALQQDTVSLIKTLNDPDPFLQVIAIRGIRRTPDKQAAIPSLIQLLRTTTNERVANEVLAALGTCGTPATKPILDALAEESDWTLRKRLVRALGQPSVLRGVNYDLQVRLYNLWQNEANDSAKTDMAQVLAKLES